MHASHFSDFRRRCVGASGASTGRDRAELRREMGKKASTGLLLLLSLAGSSLIEDEPLSAAALPDDDGGEERDKPALPVVKVRVTPPPPTGDSEVYCGLWANEGHCDLNSDYMLHHCAGSCEVRYSLAPAPIVAADWPVSPHRQSTNE